ncbi:MAG: LEA type 2 family protein [Nitrospinae bacterium]|nr:LEA type 2 family protein [Nitrospinota bacterium]
MGRNNSYHGIRYNGNFCLTNISLLFTSLLLLFSSCQNQLFKKPDITIRSIEIVSPGFKDFVLNLRADIFNPNLISFEIEKFFYKIKIEGNEIISGELKERVEVKARGNAPFMISARVGIDNPDFLKTTLIILNGDKVKYQIEGQASLNTSLGKKIIKIDKTDEYIFKK